MKKSLILFLIFALCGCQTIVENTVQRRATGVYESFWNSLNKEYVNFDRCDEEYIYEEGLALFDQMNLDSMDVNKRTFDSVEMAIINQLLIGTDSLICMFKDYQLKIYPPQKYTYPCSEYNPDTILKYSRYLLGPADTDFYTADCNFRQELSENGIYLNSGYKFLNIISKASNKRYMHFAIWHNVGISQAYLSRHFNYFLEQDISGIIIDLRAPYCWPDSIMMHVLPYFLPDKDTVVCYMQRRSAPKDKYSLSPKEPMVIRGNNMFYNKIPICVIFEEHTRGVTNNIAHIMAKLPKVETISMSESGGAGCLTQRFAIYDKDDVIAYAEIPNRKLSNESTDFSTPLKPTIQVPYRYFIPGNAKVDDNILAAIQYLDGQ